MPLRVYWLLLLNLAVNISAETVYSSGSQYGREIGNLAEAERTPATSESLPQEVSCSGVKGQGPCSEMVSTGGSNDPSFQAASYNGTFSFSGVASQGSRHDIIQLGDAYSSPVFASSLNSSPSVRGSNLVQNLQPVVSNNNAEYDPSTPHIASYGSVYRLLKPHGAYSSSRTVPSASYKLPISSSVTTMSKSIPNGQNGYKPGFSQISYDATQQGDANNSVAATYYSRNKPSLSSMVISSGPMIKFIMPNESNYQLVQTINKAQSSNEPDTSIKPLVTVDLPTTETSKPFEHSQGMIYQRPTSQPQVPNESRCQCPQTVKKPIASPKPHLASKNPSTLQSKTTETRFTHLGNAYSSVDTTHKSSSVFKPAQTTYMQQIAQQLAGFSQDDVHDSSSTVEPLSGSVYTRPGYVYGTFVNTGASMYMPSSSAKTVQSNYMQHFYEAGLYFTKVVYGSSSSAVASGDSKDGFTLSGNANSSADNTYTSNSQPTASGSNLSQNPYFIARQGQSSYSMFKPQQPNYKSFPTRYMQIPSKSFNTSFSQKDSVQDSEQLNQMRNQLPDIQAVTSEGFQTWHHSVLVSAPLQDSDQKTLKELNICVFSQQKTVIFIITPSQSMSSLSLSAMPQVPSLGRRATSHRYICTKVLLAEGEETPFTEHCRNYEHKYQILQTEIQKLKDQMQELHRDLTKHHSLINTDSTEEILERSVHIDEQIEAQYSAMQTLRTMFEEACEEPFQRGTNEQEIYEAQLHDLLQLKQENSYLMTIARQIGPYILSIAKVKERLDPRFQEPKEPEDDRTETMLKIYEDSIVTSESQQSNDESSFTVYSRDSHRHKKAGILQHEAPKNSDHHWQSKHRNISETTLRKELPF